MSHDSRDIEKVSIKLTQYIADLCPQLSLCIVIQNNVYLLPTTLTQVLGNSTAEISCKSSSKLIKKQQQQQQQQ